MNYKFLVIIFFHNVILGGFKTGTLVKTPTNWTIIENISVGDYVESLNCEELVHNKITHKRVISEKAVSIVLDGESVIASREQKFYLASGIWQKAKSLKPGDVLFSHDKDFITIQDVHEIEQEVKLYEITVENVHTYLVTQHGILVHNAVPVIIGLSWIFGSGTIEFVGTSIACGVLGFLGIKFYKNKNHNYEDFRIGEYSISFKKSNATDRKEQDKGAQAPGKPTKVDGYEPPKRWDGKRVKHPRSGRYGWPDKNGNIWIPTGPGPLAHGGPHWDVQDPKGKTYDNVYPGGYVRPGNK